MRIREVATGIRKAATGIPKTGQPDRVFACLAFFVTPERGLRG